MPESVSTSPNISRTSQTQAEKVQRRAKIVNLSLSGNKNGSIKGKSPLLSFGGKKLNSSPQHILVTVPEPHHKTEVGLSCPSDSFGRWKVPIN